MNAIATDITAATAAAVDPAFVYVVYIQTTPQKVWDALTTPETQRLFWFGQHTQSDWKTGSPHTHVGADGAPNFSGEVLESDPPRKLTFTFLNSDRYPVMHAEGPSRASYLIEDVTTPGDRALTRLTLTHDGFSKLGSRSREGVSGGWTRILSNLKTLLETGVPLPAIKAG
ncbi:MAG: hypothetical protein JWP35_2856 [Caulobacter sp.]|nr:hypothetical protein [Caulobacter sp.]